MTVFYPAGATHRIFLATPISSFDDAREATSFRELTQCFEARVREIAPGASVRSEILVHATEDDYENPDVAIAEDFGAIALCTHFVLVYPRPLATSALMELGYAMAMNTPCLIYASSVDELPYLAKPSGESGEPKVLPLQEYGKATDGLRSFLEP